MSCLKAFVLAVTTLLVINFVSAGLSHGTCPERHKVYNDKPRCHSDSDCQKWGKVCCPNQLNTKSCVDRVPWNNAANSQNKYTGGGGGGVYCEGVKCRPYEVCKPDPITKRLKCQRP